MTEPLERSLSSIFQEKDLPEQLTKLSKLLSEKSETKDYNTIKKSENQQDRLTLKINLLNSIIPLLSEKAADQARFLIKLLSVISFLQNINTTQN